MANIFSFLGSQGLPNVNQGLPSWLTGQPDAQSLPIPEMLGGNLPQVPPLSNFMQQAGATPDAPQPAPVSQAPEPAARQPRERRSVLDTIGRISDVLAKVGGADALYQPTLDAREDRAQSIDLDKMRKTLLEQQIAAGGVEATSQQNALLGNAVRGLQAIQQRGGDISKAWPLLAQQAGIPPERAAQLQEIFASNPEAIRGMATMLGQQQEFGLQPFYAQGADGKLQAYQLGKDGTVQAIQLGDGEAPIDPLKFVDLGGAQAGVGTRSGAVTRILPKTEAPGRAADRSSRERIAAGGNASRERIAAMPARAKPGTGAAADGGDMAATARGNLNELRGIYESLNKMGALVSPQRGAGSNIAARARASGVGQMLEGAVGTEAQTLRDRIASIRPSLMQSIAQATGMTGKQLDSNSDVKLFMQTVTNPASSYEANLAAIKGLERLLASSGKKPASSGGGNRSAAPRRPSAGGGKPTVSNW